MLIVGPDDEFNRRLASLLGVNLVPIERRKFPDGEVCPRVLGKVQGEDVILSLRMKAGAADVNDYLVELLLTVRNLKEHMGAGSIWAVIPYFPYARQDEIFREGEPLSSKYVAELLEESGVEGVFSVTVHLHRRKSFNELFSRAEAINVDGMKSLARYLRELSLENPFVLGPDTESIVWARDLAGYLGTQDYDSFRKERDLATGEIKTTAKELDLKGRTVIIADDIVSTGGTMANAVREAKRMGAKLVISAFVHPVLAKGAFDRILGAGADMIIGTDTLEWAGSKASVVQELADSLKEVLKLGRNPWPA